MEKEIIKISVRDLVSFSCPSRSNDTYSFLNHALEGIYGHKSVTNDYMQKYTELNSEYLSEVTIKYQYELTDYTVELSGRIDGVIISSDTITINEIKTVDIDLDRLHFDYDPSHIAQCSCYAYLYALINNIDKLKLMLTYYNRKTSEKISFSKSVDMKQLQNDFLDLIYPYINWYKKKKNWQSLRDISIKALNFPFNVYRKGQRNFAVAVYKTIADGKRLYVQAPTGTGKTMATLFPSIKAIAEGHIDRIFYLTAKTITRTVAKDAYMLMARNGLLLRTITITAKEKLCLNPQGKCDPEYCDYIRDFQARVSSAAEDIIDEYNLYDREVILEYAKKYNICPFEFTLFLSLYCDLVICDYNYLFDPIVCLKRFFYQGTSEKYAFLIDEAHNLVDRGREMYSATISKSAFLSMHKQTKNTFPNIAKHLSKINTELLNLKKSYMFEEDTLSFFHAEDDKPKELIVLIDRFIDYLGRWLEAEEECDFREDLIDLFFSCQHFSRIAAEYDDCYETFYKIENNEFIITLFCIDPSKRLNNKMTFGSSSILFSATLSPIKYFKQVLGGNFDDRHLIIPSPFPRENLCLYIDDSISTKYKQRQFSYTKIAHIIYASVNMKVGNYLIFFPSFQYMNSVLEEFNQLENEFEILTQSSTMTEIDREDFLSHFDEFGSRTLIGFAVMGGIFGEGIDLYGEKLSGVVVVGVGLPQITPERDRIMNYYNKKDGYGFDFSYTYPGINRVLQAAGRVIRTSSDKGFVILIDERFNTIKYKNLFPSEWLPCPINSEKKDMLDIIEEFWSY